MKKTGSSHPGKSRGLGSCLTSTIILLIILTSMTSCVYYNTYYNAKKHFRNAEKDNENIGQGRQQTQNYNKAIDTAAKIPELHPDSKYVDDALLLMGKCYYIIGNYPKGQRKFEELLTNYPDSPLKDEASLYKAKCLIENRSFDQARETLQKLTDSEAEKSIILESRFGLGEILFIEEKYIQSADVYTKIAQDHSKNEIRARANLKAAECYFLSAKYIEAAESYLQGSKYHKYTLEVRFDALYQRALCLRNAGNYNDAESQLNNILKDQKFFIFHPKAQALLAEIIYYNGEVEEAVEVLDEVIEAKPKSEESAHACYLLGMINNSHFADYIKAEEFLKKVKTEKGDSPFADSAEVMLKNITSWRDVSDKIENLKTLIISDINFLAGIEDTTAVADSTMEDESQIRKLFGTEESKLEVEGEIEGVLLDIDGGGKDEEEQPELTETTISMPDSLSDSLAIIEAGSAAVDSISTEGLLNDSLAQESDSLRASFLAEQAVQDTVDTKQRIDDNSRKLSEYMFQLAEVLHFQMNNTDSSKIILEALIDSSDIDISPNAIFLLAHISLMEKDTVRTDFLNRSLVEQYPKTSYALKAAETLGIVLESTVVDSGKLLFMEAENRYFSEGDIEGALDEYSQVDSLYPLSDYAAKALFAQAYIYRYDYNDDSTALEIYSQLAEQFPEDTLGKIAKKRSSSVFTPTGVDSSLLDSAEVGIEYEGEAYLIDEVDERPVCAMDSAQISQYILDNGFYPQTALSAQKNGVVTLELTIDMYGYTKEIAIKKEIPEGYGFGDAAEELAPDLIYMPGKIGNQVVEVRLEQKIYFTR